MILWDIWWDSKVMAKRPPGQTEESGGFGVRRHHSGVCSRNGTYVARCFRPRFLTIYKLPETGKMTPNSLQIYILRYYDLNKAFLFNESKSKYSIKINTDH